MISQDQNSDRMHIQMELKPTDNNTCSSESHEVFDDHLEKIVQEFNEFQGRMSEKCCTGSMRLEDLIDMYINSGGVIVNSPVDLTESESALLPHQVQSAHGFSIHRETQESDIMIDEIIESEDTSQNDTGNFPDSSPTVNTNSSVGAGGNSLKVTHIRYGDLNCPGVADSVIGSVSGCSAETVFRSVMKSFRTPAGAGGKNLWQQAHSTHIRSQLLKLHEKNEHLRKSVTFLESQKRINLCPESLRRTISNPQ